MLTFSCAACRKKLRLREHASGKKVRCPHCGAVGIAPAAPTSDAAATEDWSGRPADEEVTQPPPGTSEVTRSPQSAGGADTSLTEFLAPPEAAGELGRLGGYRILKVLGHGGMGVVFEAEDPQLRRKLAVKAMLPALAASATARLRFLREAKTAAAIEHDHIVTIYRVGEDRGVPFIAMPLLKGEPLDQRLKREPALPIADVLRIGRETALGLAAAHATGLIHRDIKPANLWLETKDEGRGMKAEKAGGAGSSFILHPSSFRVKILDFGLARAAVDSRQLTQQGAIIGTPAYMAPEQAAGEAVDRRCDLFSLGCVLYRLATGTPPFKGSDTITTLIAVATASPVPPVELRPELPGALSDLILQLLAKRPGQRPASADRVAEALAAIEGQLVPARPAPSPAPRPAGARHLARRPRIWPWLAGAAVMALGALALCVLLVMSLLPGWGRHLPGPVGDDPPGGPPALQGAEPLAQKITNGLGMDLVLIPAGTFMMGSPAEEIDRCVESFKFTPADYYLSEGPQHSVEITRPFYMGTTEVTVGQYRRFIEASKYQVEDARWLQPGWQQTEDHPVTFITRRDAIEFCCWLSQREGVTYRLPTEAEWEYACRAGSKPGSRYCYGDDDAELGEYAWHFPNAGGRPHPVGQLKPNAWGLYDIHGNVFEYCLDDFNAGAYAASAKQDPSGGPGLKPVMRGGAFIDSPHNSRCAFRARGGPFHRLDPVGFRVVQVVADKPAPAAATFKNGLGMEFAHIPAGTFAMGSAPAEIERCIGQQPGWPPADLFRAEGPVHQVTISKLFYLGKMEVTVGQFRAFVQATGYQTQADKDGGAIRFFGDAGWRLDPNTNFRSPGFTQTDAHPVTCVSWNDAVAFCAWLSKAHAGRYRLPTEAEWEYACRAGVPTRHAAGDDDLLLKEFGNLADESVLGHSSGFRYADGRMTWNDNYVFTAPVGRFKANAFGLYDMHGNVWEWCADWYDKDYYRNSPKEDPTGPKTGTLRVLRGGAWDREAIHCRSAFRFPNDADNRSWGLGFRVVLER
jgi:eukaryotic-like serine/threonine-protein kinase